jgi:ethanolamine ammonia-lyase small subunit
VSEANLPSLDAQRVPDVPAGDPLDLVRAIRARTPARILVGRAGPSYTTATQLDLRRDHAAALDAVQAELDLKRDFGHDFIDRFRLFEVATVAGSKTEYLMRPDLGRRLNDAARAEILRHCPAGTDLQVAIGDGLSAAAVVAQVPVLLPLLEQLTRERRWTFGRPFFIRHCRVGVMNDVGALLNPAVVVLLIGERPGLATVESLSAYMAYRPCPGHTDAQRNLISNIHARGVTPQGAAGRIVNLAQQMRQLQGSGVSVKEAARPACEHDPLSPPPPSLL